MQKKLWLHGAAFVCLGLPGIVFACLGCVSCLGLSGLLWVAWGCFELLELELRFARISAEEELLALRSNWKTGIWQFSERLAYFALFFLTGWLDRAAILSMRICCSHAIQSQLRSGHPA